MICKRCGRELSENGKFCPDCGAPVNTDTENVSNDKTEENAAPECEIRQGIGITGISEVIRELKEQFDKWKKLFKIVATIVAVVYACLVVRNLSQDINAVLAGSKEMAKLITGIGIGLLCTCGILYLAAYLCLRFIILPKVLLTETYLTCFYIYNKEDLIAALRNMHCRAVKEIYLDEYGNICVAGKKGTHVFTVKDGRVTMDTDELKYKGYLEQETIVACLVKFLIPEAPINAYKTEKNNKWLSRVQLILVAATLVSGAIFVAGALTDKKGQNYIDMVRKSSPEAYPDITYEEAFDDFFDNARWKYFQSDTGKDVVEFQGECMYDDDTATVLIQFLLNKDKGIYKIYTMAIDDEEQSLLVYAVLMDKVFGSYGTGNESESGKIDEMEIGEAETDALKEDVPKDEYESDGDDSTVDDSGEDEREFREWLQAIGGSVNYENIYSMAGLWGNGDTALSISIYSDSDTYESGDEIGSCFLGDAEGTAYYLGYDGEAWYVQCGVEQGDEFIILQYTGTDEMTVFMTSEGLDALEGQDFFCEEHYES